MNRGIYRAGLALVGVLLAACDSPMESLPLVPPVPANELLVSNPVTSPAGPPAGLDQVTFVSVAPGTLASGKAVSIEVHRTGEVFFGVLINGGLDPLAIPASVGDSVTLTVTGPSGPGEKSGFRVPPRKPPTVVRTFPQPNKRDVPLNTRAKAVLSEPIDFTTLTVANVELRTGTITVPGQLRFANPEQTVVEFVPASDLAPGTDYELVIRPGLQDLDGTPLEALSNISFTTGSAPEPVGQLAFVRDGQIHLINTDGTGLVPLTQPETGGSNANPAWSPDGQRLAFASDRDGEWNIYVMNADGSGLVRLTSGGYNDEPAWSPDGKTIAFTRLQDGSAGIFAVNAEGGTDLRVVVNRPGYDAMPAWLPGGLQLTFTSDWRAYDFLYDLYLVNADGSGITPLLEGPFFSADGQTFYFQSAWSPDGRQFAVVVCPYAFDNCFPIGGVAVANSDGSDLTVIAQAGGYSRPTWSPDGKLIAFSSTSCRECQPTLRLVRVDGSAEDLITTNGHSPAWRP